ncbi:MAG TPA: ASKHA domain-containing protein [Verrucomicrobiae bacterium]|nr:ASKHA domain-containing protein [Verrucomicrobiae bacterium]
MAASCASAENLALAFDAGTTTLAGSLLDTASGLRLASASAPNPQREYGADVVSRMEAAHRSPGSAQRLSSLLTLELQRLGSLLLEECGAPWGRVGSVGIAANTAVTHLLLGLPVKSLIFPPHRPPSTGSRKVSTASVGWERDIPAFVFPLPGGFVGGDAVAFLHAELRPGETSLFLDIGTNSEIALSTPGGILATAAAAGPALEGGNLACGMAAVPGAVRGVSIDGDRVRLDTIGGGRPSGLCGSGVVEAISQLRRAGIIDAGGALLPPGEVPTLAGVRVVERDGAAAFLLYRDAGGELLLTQEDIRQAQLAKGAIRAGIEVLLERAGVPEEGVERLVVTGAFGAGLSPAGLKTLGIVSAKMIDICAFAGEGALRGVEAALRSGGSEEVEKLAASIRVIPLSGTPSFERHFLRQLDFPDVS